MALITALSCDADNKILWPSCYQKTTWSKYWYFKSSPVKKNLFINFYCKEKKIFLDLKQCKEPPQNMKTSNILLKNFAIKDHLLFVIHKIIINTEIFVGIEVLNTFTLRTKISYLNSNKRTFEKPEDFIQKLFKRLFLKNCLQIYNQLKILPKFITLNVASPPPKYKLLPRYYYVNVKSLN